MGSYIVQILIVSLNNPQNVISFTWISGFEVLGANLKPFGCSQVVRLHPWHRCRTSCRCIDAEKRGKWAHAFSALLYGQTVKLNTEVEFPQFDAANESAWLQEKVFVETSTESPKRLTSTSLYRLALQLHARLFPPAKSHSYSYDIFPMSLLLSLLHFFSFPTVFVHVSLPSGQKLNECQLRYYFIFRTLCSFGLYKGKYITKHYKKLCLLYYVCLSISPHETIQESPNAFSWIYSYMLGTSNNICKNGKSVIRIGQQ
jgi:hypothetical protein